MRPWPIIAEKRGHRREPAALTLEAGEAQAERAQPGTRRFVIRLRLSARWPQPIEEQAAAPFELWRKHEIHDGVRSLLDRARRRGAGLANHGGVHIGRGMEAVHRDALVRELLGKIDGEHDLRELALRIGARTV